MTKVNILQNILDEKKSKERLFIIGCSRSGTTILQKYLSSNLNFLTLPETDFFGIAAGGGFIKYYLTYLGLANKNSIKAIKNLYDILGEYNKNEKKLESYKFKHYANAFIDTLDAMSDRYNMNGWIEKTPKHFKKTRLITKYVKNAKYVHILRYGPDVVASIVDRAYKHSDHFKDQKNPIYAIMLWNKSIHTALKNYNKQNHALILYEDFCEDPKKATDQIIKRLKIQIHEANTHFSLKQNIIKDSESWKIQDINTIGRAKTKFYDIFTKKEQDRILKKLNLKDYSILKEKIRIK